MKSSKTLPSKWRRTRNGRFAPKLKNIKIVVGLVLSIMTMSVLNQSREHQEIMDILYPQVMFRQPDSIPQLVGQVKAKEIETSSAPASPTIEDRIRMRFQENGEKMIKIARCESGIRPEAVGDKNLTFEKDGITYGTSHGIFQVRYLKGRPTPEQLHDVNTNIEMAYKISNGGKDTGAWRNCTRKLGL